MPTICFDLGNTRKKAAFFLNGNKEEEFILEYDLLDHVTDLLERFKPTKTILSSVIDHPPAVEELLTSSSRFHKLSTHTKLNFTLEVDKPETVGADRLALCAAAAAYFPGRHNLIVSLGSCITYNYLRPDLVFAGGSISPGLDMRFRAMNTFTAKLPSVSADPVKTGWGVPLIGYNTLTNMQSGVIFGIISEIEGIAERYRERFNDLNCILTGGNADYFAGQLKSRIFADSDFLFKGLYVLSEINNAG